MKLVLTVLLAFVTSGGYLLLRSKNMHIWIVSHILHVIKNAVAEKPRGITHIIFCFVDHYEPKWEQPAREIEQARVDTWVKKYPELADRHRDSDGKPPQHTWFYPAEEYEQAHLEKLSALCRQGYGEIELHLHHHDDTSEGVRAKIDNAVTQFGNHGALRTVDESSGASYAFIHGNWALDNSNSKGIQCGVNDELIILRETGCYADFTLPSAPSSCQTKKINSIYYATDDPLRPKSHDTGINVRVGGKPCGDLMIIQGPLSLNWKRRKYGVLPRIENGEVSGRNPATGPRIDSWIRQRVRVEGNNEWIFVKVHCHGTQEGDHDALLGREAGAMYEYLEKTYNDGENYRLHYVTARECYNIIKAAEANEKGDPHLYRDYVIKKYRNSGTMVAI